VGVLGVVLCCFVRAVLCLSFGGVAGEGLSLCSAAVGGGVCRLDVFFCGPTHQPKPELNKRGRTGQRRRAECDPKIEESARNLLSLVILNFWKEKTMRDQTTAK